MADRRPRGWFTRDEVITAIAQRYLDGESVAAIAADLGCSIDTIYTALQIACVNLRPGGLSSDPAAVEQILARRRAGEALHAIAADYGVSRQAVSDLCARHGVGDLRPRPAGRPELAALIRSRLEQGCTKTAIARDLRTSRAQLDRLLRRQEVAA